MKTAAPLKKLMLAGYVASAILLAAWSEGLSVSHPTRAGWAVLQELTPTPPPEATPTPTRVPGAEIVIEKTVESRLVNDLNENGLIDPGDTVQYSITYSNNSAATLTNVRLVDDYDETAIANIANITSVGIDNKENIIWDLGTLPPAGSGMFTYEATLSSAFPPEGPRRVENKVAITSDQADSVSTSLAIDVRTPKLKISKDREGTLIRDVDADGKPGPGDTIRYIISVKNDSSDIEATNVLIKDDYEQSHLEPTTGISQGGVNDGDVISWDLGRLEAGEEVKVTYDATVTSAFQVGRTTVKNTVTVSSQGTTPISAVNSFDIEVIATPTPTEAPTSASQSAGPTSAAIDPTSQAILAGAFMLFAFGGLTLLAYKEILSADTLRDGYLLSLLMGVVIILGLAGSVERSAIAGLIGTVAGYVLKSAVIGGQGPTPPRAPRRRAPRGR